MIQISGGSKRFGEKFLFEGLNWLISPNDRIGIVGANGSGKTTLLRIIEGTENLESGSITLQKGLKIGYLPQDGLSLSGRTLFDECLSAFGEVLALEREQEELAHKMGELNHESSEHEVVTDRYQWVTDRYNALDGYTKEAQTGSVLEGLGFLRNDWQKRTEKFSGGWQMRIVLAKLLLEKPTVLLLDEPTNHLDLEARNWLESYLNNYPFAYLVVSHDRYFLDMTVMKIMEIWNKKVHFFSGDYSKYETLKQQRLEQLEAAYKNQQNHIHHLEKFISRFRYQATKASQVQSRIKELDKIERIAFLQEEKTVHFKFPQPSPSGRVVIELHNMAKSYGSHVVFRDINVTIEKGDRIALVGVNGAGKSTLIRILAGQEPLTEGTRKEGYKVDINYFAQDQYKVLNPKALLLEDLAALVPRASDIELRGLLGCFLFSGDEVYKSIGVLSGGERNRYAIARTLVQPSNFLLLDEPTNHLDMRAKDMLLQALLAFKGTVVFVSHDRYFIDRLTTKVFAVGNGEVLAYPGSYDDYLWRMRRNIEQPEEQSKAGVSESLQAALAHAAKEQNGGSQPSVKKRMNPLQATLLREKLTTIEQEIAACEQQTEELQKQLEGGSTGHQQSAKILERMETLRWAIQAYEEKWAKLSEKLEADA